MSHIIRSCPINVNEHITLLPGTLIWQLFQQRFGVHYNSLSSLCGSDVPKNSFVYDATVFVGDCVRSLQFDPHKYSGKCDTQQGRNNEVH